MDSLYFTYTQPNRTELLQGDLLKRTPELDSIIAQVHPHYLRREYTHFQVITQSCDLVNRNGSCKARYITIAAVRSLETVIAREIEKAISRRSAVRTSNSIVCSAAIKPDLMDFLKKIYNNNSKDFFFLHAQPDLGLESDSCTFLSLSIAIKAEIHYEACLSSKILQLEDNFQSKLGWMVGNLYSRVGTKDIVPSAQPTVQQFNQLIEGKLLNYLSWAKEDEFKFYVQRSNEPSVTEEQIRKDITDQKQKLIDQGIANIIKAVKADVGLDATQEQKITNRLAKNPYLIARFTRN